MVQSNEDVAEAEVADQALAEAAELLRLRLRLHGTQKEAQGKAAVQVQGAALRPGSPESPKLDVP